MALDRQLRRWQEAGLLDGAQLAAIVAHERGRQRPWLLYSVAGLGALAIAIGLIAVVASNWEALGDHFKLGADLLVGAGLLYGLGRAITEDRGIAREVMLLLVWGWTLASIALVGQVYQLGGQAWQALAAWSVLTAPLMTYTRSPWVASSGLTGLLLAFGFAIAEPVARALPDPWTAGLAGLPLPLAALTVASPALTRRVPAITRATGRMLWFALLALLLVVPQLWYLELRLDRHGEILPFVTCALVYLAVVSLCAPRLLRAAAGHEPNERALALGRGLPFAVWALLAAALFLAHDQLGVVAALAFIGLSIGAAALASEVGRPRLVNLATGLIALRLLIVYFEVFGSLMDTGVGLIGGGLLALGLAWGWNRARRRPVGGAASSPSPAPASAPLPGSTEGAYRSGQSPGAGESER